MSKILYLTDISPYHDGSLSIVDIGTGSETYLDCGLGCHSPGLTSDGSGLMYALGGSAGDLLALPGTRVTIPDLVASATLSGDGRVAYVVTDNSRLLRVDATSGDITELAGSTAQITNAYLLNVSPANPIYSATAGEVLALVGSGDMQTADFCGHPSSRLAGSGNRFQVPFDAPDGDCQIIVRGVSPFENAISLSIVSLDPRFSGNFILHQNFNIITQSNPAQPGEDIVTYMTGLGRLNASGNMQQELADRFHVSAHRETREMPVFVLKLIDGAPKAAGSGGPVQPGCWGRAVPRSDSREIRPECAPPRKYRLRLPRCRPAP